MVTNKEEKDPAGGKIKTENSGGSMLVRNKQNIESSLCLIG